MNLNNFEKNIDPQTLKRGYNYFKNGNVLSVGESDIYYSAGALAEIFKEENNTERLLKLVQNNPDDLRFIDEHAVHLRDKYPEEIISLYVAAIKSLAKITDVKIYYEVVKYMKNLSKVKGSEIKLRQLLNYFKEFYRSRRKMMELLNENFPVNINQT